MTDEPDRNGHAPATPEELDLTRRLFLGVSTGSVLATGQAGAAAEPPPQGAGRRPVQFRVNGSPVNAHVEPRVSLLDYLRDHLHLTGAKKGCNEGACGACTVLVNGARVNSCLTLTVQCEGAEVTTIEGIGTPEKLHLVQQSFIEHDAFQCGYCTPGQILSAIACIEEGHADDPASVREWMSGNICRCSAYPQITTAVLAAAAKTRS